MSYFALFCELLKVEAVYPATKYPCNGSKVINFQISPRAADFLQALGSFRHKNIFFNPKILETGMRVRELRGRMGFKLGHTLKGLFKGKQVI